MCLAEGRKPSSKPNNLRVADMFDGQNIGFQAFFFLPKKLNMLPISPKITFKTPYEL
jgi:hypothetical protein